MMSELSPRRLVVRMPNWLGDCVMAAPVITGVKKVRPGISITLMVKESFAGLGDIINGVDGVIALGADSGAAVQKVREGGFDAALILPNSFRSVWEMWRAKVPVRAGYASDFRAALLTHRIPRPERHSLHMTEYYLRVAKSLFPETNTAERCLSIPTSALAESLSIFSKRSRPVVGFGFGASFGSAKMWPKERYAELIRKIADKVDVVLLGAESDRAVEREILQLSGGKAVSLVGKTDLVTLAAVMSRLGLYITNDTGPMHIAAGLGVPTIAIFGPTSPEETQPLGANVSVIRHKADCAPCFKRECPTDHRCMTAVTVDEVLERTIKMIRPEG